MKTVAFALLALFVTASGEGHHAIARPVARLHCSGNPRVFINLWNCGVRDDMLAGEVLQSRFHVINYYKGMPHEVIEPTYHRRGVLRYELARLRDVSGMSGVVELPLDTRTGRYWLVWKFDGEFVRYKGIR